MTRARAGAVLSVLALAGCGGEEPERVAAPPHGSEVVGLPGHVHLAPGPGDPERIEVRNPYADDPRAIREGERFYIAYNCADCHGTRGGGGMGPPLRDDTWIYGGEPVSIYKSIMEGRPEGMPTWIGMLPEDQAWKIVAYVQSLGSGMHGPPSMMPPENRAPWLESRGSRQGGGGSGHEGDDSGHEGGGS